MSDIFKVRMKWDGWDLTEGKIYEAKKACKGWYLILSDDAGDENSVRSHWCEVVEDTPETKSLYDLAAELAPLLWNAYKDKLKTEALDNLADVIVNQDIPFEDDEDISVAFTWSNPTQGVDYWIKVYEGEYDIDAKSVPETEDVPPTHSPVQSDGGSSEYYKLKIKTKDGEFECEMGDIIYALVGGDFDLGNILKATRRAYLAAMGGGKAGIDVSYDMNKIQWFAEDYKNRFGGK